MTHRALAFVIAVLAATGCTLECELPDCDIRDDACQRAVTDAVVCVRGGDSADVELRVVDADAYIEENVEAALSSDGVECAEQWYRALTLIDLTSTDLDVGSATESSLSRIAAFHSRADGVVTILDRGQPMRGLGATSLLFHELVHAFQDAEYDLTAWYDEHWTSFDAGLALSAMVEGEAKLYTDHAIAFTAGFDPEHVEWNRAYEVYREYSLEDSLWAADPFLFLRSNFVYAEGVTYVEDVWRENGNDGVRAIFDAPPTSTRDVLTGAHGALNLGDDEVDQVPDMAHWGFRYVGSARLGSYALGVLLRRYEWPYDPEARTSDGTLERDLETDFLSMFENEQGFDVLLAWRLRFGSQGSAETVADILEVKIDRSLLSRSAARVSRDGTLVSLAIMTSERTAAAWLDDLVWMAAPTREPDESDFGCRPRPEPDPYVAIGVGDTHACVVRRTGAVRCFGEASLGRLGYGNPDNIGDDELAAIAGNVPLGFDAVTITAGRAHTCARSAAGNVRCWGEAAASGYGGAENIGLDVTPAEVGDVDIGGTVTQVSAGGGFTCALLDTGNVRCWGIDTRGQLGYGGARSPGETPAAAGDLDIGARVEQVATGESHACALIEGGRVRCWGNHVSGALGYAGLFLPIGDDETPAEVGDVPIDGTVVRVAAGKQHTCVLLDTGRVRCWGVAENGRLGVDDPDGQTVIFDPERGTVILRLDDASMAVDVDVGGDVVDIACGSYHTCALLDTGAVRCWGSSHLGQLGYGDDRTIGDTEPPSSAGDVDVGGKVIAIAAGGSDTCAILETGGVRCWGNNRSGQLGYGHTDDIGDDETPAEAGDVPL